jgi:hypothetical protein
MTRQLKAHAAVLLANIFFAISYIAIKYVVPGQVAGACAEPYPRRWLCNHYSGYYFS